MKLSDRTKFSPIVETYWASEMCTARIYAESEHLIIYESESLDLDYPALILHREEKTQVQAVMHPTLLYKMQKEKQYPENEAQVEAILPRYGLSLYPADNVYYYAKDDQQKLVEEVTPRFIRQLTWEDESRFEAFTKHIRAADLDAAYVELSHWAVFGLFTEDKLVAVASVYAWEQTKIMDIGVLTDERYRGKGYAKQVVRAISRYVVEQGYELQYRCQLDHVASIGLAQSCGLTLFGRWRTAIQDE